MITNRDSDDRPIKKRKLTELKLFPNESSDILDNEAIIQNLRHFFSIPFEDIVENFLGGKHELAELVFIRLINLTPEKESHFNKYIKQKKSDYLVNKDINQPYKPREMLIEVFSTFTAANTDEDVQKLITLLQQEPSQPFPLRFTILGMIYHMLSALLFSEEYDAAVFKSRDYFLQAIENGCPHAYALLADLRVKSIHNQTLLSNLPGALQILEKGLGTAYGIFNLGQLLSGTILHEILPREPEDVNTLYREAEKLYRLAAARGVIVALYRLAGLYEEGHGVVYNPDEALRLYTAMYDIVGNKSTQRSIQFRIWNLFNKNPDHFIVCYQALVLLQDYSDNDRIKITQGFQVFENSHFPQIIKLCEKEDNAIIQLVFNSFSQDFRRKLALQLNTAISVLSQSETHDHLSNEIILKILAYLMGVKPARLLMNGELLANEISEERLANLTLVKFDKKMNNTFTTQYHGLWRQPIARAECGEITYTEAVEQIRQLSK